MRRTGACKAKLMPFVRRTIESTESLVSLALSSCRSFAVRSNTHTTGKQLSSGVTRFDVNWFVNWFVSLVVNIYTMSHVTFPTRTSCANLSQSNATTGCLYLYKMPPLFFITPDNQTFQGNLVSATTQTNHLKQDQLAITTSEVLYFSLISILIISVYQYFITAWYNFITSCCTFN